MADKCRICGTQLDSNICPYCGLNNSRLSDKDAERVFITLWGVLTATTITVTLLCLNYKYGLCIIMPLAGYCTIMLIGTLLQHIFKLIFATNIACFIAVLGAPLPAAFIKPRYEGWGEVAYILFFMVPIITISIITNICSIKRKMKP